MIKAKIKKLADAVPTRPRPSFHGTFAWTAICARAKADYIKCCQLWRLQILFPYLFPTAPFMQTNHYIYTDMRLKRLIE